MKKAIPGMLDKYELIDYPNKILKAYNFCSRFSHFTYFLKKYIVEPLIEEKETPLNRFIRTAFYFSGGSTVSPEDLTAQRHLTTALNHYLDSMVYVEKSDKPVVWAQWNYSIELLHAFDINRFIPETLTTIANFKGADEGVKVLAEAEREGISKEYCSSARYSVGSYLLNQLPKPDLIVTSSHPCDTNVSIYQTLKYLTKAPMFTLDSPYWNDEDSHKYYAENIWGLIRFLEKHLDQKMDWDRMKEICLNMNETYYYLQELSEMSRVVPSPVTYHSMLYSWLVRVSSIGAPEVTEAARLTYEIAKKRLAKGQGYLKDEKIRLIWFDVPIGFYFINAWMEKEFGVATVADFMGRTYLKQIDTSSEESIIRDMAINSLNIGMARQCRGPIEFYTEELERILKQYSADCLFFTGHEGCKHGKAAMAIKKNICKEAGLPALYMQADIFDKRILSEDQMKKQIAEFFKSNGLI
jgi:benzoyl-CoA reductase subunit B